MGVVLFIIVVLVLRVVSLVGGLQMIASGYQDNWLIAGITIDVLLVTWGLYLLCTEDL